MAEGCAGSQRPAAAIGETLVPIDSIDEFRRLLPWLRSQFPQLDQLRDGRWRLYLDNAAGTLVPRTVSDAMAEAALWANAQPSRAWPHGPETRREHRLTRELLADFLNAREGEPIYFSESATACLYKLRESLEPAWGSGDNVIVTDCDHFANISAWEWRARWEVRRARMERDGGLDLEHLCGLLDGSTRVVALTLAGNGLGTIIPIEAAVKEVRARAPQALVVVDAVHGAPHRPIDVQQLGVDALVFSTYKLFGPFGGVLWLSSELSDRLQPYHVDPHTDRETLLEWGSLDNVAVAGVRAALEYLESLGERLERSHVGQFTGYPRRRRRFKLALQGIDAHETDLTRHVLQALAQMPAVTLYGVTEPERAAERVPTFAFELAGLPLDQLEETLWKAGGVQVAVGNHYSAGIARGLGKEALARASFAHYHTLDDADAFLRTLTAI